MMYACQDNKGVMIDILQKIILLNYRISLFMCSIAENWVEPLESE